MNFVIGQRFYSETEPELGLGVITQIEGKIVKVLYPLSQEIRNYSQNNAPLKRFELNPGDHFYIQNSKHTLIESNQKDQLFYYKSEAGEFCETLLDGKIEIDGPLERFFILNHDPLSHYDLRYQTALHFRKYGQFKHKGFLGAKIRLIPHQIFVANQVLSLPLPKALLCDEVGLGKTIEALLILHSLYQQQLIESCLIIVPDALKNQWFIELYKKFSLTARILNSEFEDEEINLDETRILIIGKSEIEFHPEILDKKWNMLIVDEAHQYPFKQSSMQIEFIKQVNQNTYSTLLLSATPEITGDENLFYQLQMLDKSKFQNYENFLEQKKLYQTISSLLKKLENGDDVKNELTNYLTSEEMTHLNLEEIKQALVDRYGIGRNFFRNSRDHLEKYESLFTKRKSHPIPITTDLKGLSDKKVIELKAFEILDLLKSSSDKFFIICHAKNVVLQLQKVLLEHANFKIALFHSDQSLLERDRQAAYFADPEGAQLLLCTEIGSEGRNFEFAHNLILFDLPKTPDQLEQRIGRLDRIGQKNDINIYIPYMENTFEDILFHWYKHVLGSFDHFSNAASPFYYQYREEILNLIEAPFESTHVSKFIDQKKEEFNQFKTELHNSKDLLHEIKSYRPHFAQQIIDEIHNYENEENLFKFLDSVFEQVGIEISELNDKTYFIAPSNNMLIPSYAGLSSEGASYTFDRDYTIKHENIDYLNWEHPIAKTAYDLFLNSTLGNMAIAKSSKLSKNIYFEFIFGLQCQDQFKLLASQYLPYTPIRVLLDVQKADLTQKLPMKMLNSDLTPVESETLELFKSFPKDQINAIKALAVKLTEPRITKYKSEALEQLSKETEKEINRIKNLEKDENLKIQMLEHQMLKNKKLQDSIMNCSSDLIAFRVIITA